MGIKNTRESWGWLARLFHWASAIVILFLLGVGFYMAEVLTAQDSDTLMVKFDLVQLHKSWGAVAFALACLRIIWRFFNPTPSLPQDTSWLAAALAHGGHLALYLCIFAMPISGWLMASASPMQDAYGIKNMVFGVFEMPDPLRPGSAELEELFRSVHLYVGLILSALVAGHAGAALMHHFVHRDGVLRRMITG